MIYKTLNISLLYQNMLKESIKKIPHHEGFFLIKLIGLAEEYIVKHCLVPYVQSPQPLGSWFFLPAQFQSEWYCLVFAKPQN
jgi:hypothetical protein